jgi:hypothetical protein
MSDSASRSHPTPDSEAAPEPAEGGAWELDLWDGSAWFSGWVYDKLCWPGGVKRKTLHDLRPHLAAADWDRLLAAVRSHLEQGAPLDTEILLQMPGGQVEWWRVHGAAEFNSGGHPVCLSGTLCEMSLPPGGTP